MTNAVILSYSFAMLMLTGWLCIHNRIGFDGMLICTIAMMGSFGPTVALSSLSNNLNQTLASGEKQRIGIARAFLHDAPLLLLDEPTSNLALNEGIILKALKESAKQKTVVLVSHRESTMWAADRVVKMETGSL